MEDYDWEFIEEEENDNDFIYEQEEFNSWEDHYQNIQEEIEY